FSLAHLSVRQWRKPEIRNLLLRGHLLAPLLACALVGVELLALGVPARRSAGLVIACVICASLGGIVNGAGTLAAAGIGSGLVGITAGGIAFAIGTIWTGRVTFPPVTDVGAVVADFAAG